MTTATDTYQARAARVSRHIVRALAAGTWSALETYGALVAASYGAVWPEDTDANAGK